MSPSSSRVVTIALAAGAVALLGFAWWLSRPQPHGPVAAPYRVLPAPFPAGDIDVRVLVSATAAKPALVSSPDCAPRPLVASSSGALAGTVVAIAGARAGVSPPTAGPAVTLDKCGFSPPVSAAMEGTTATFGVPGGEHRLQAFLGEVRVLDVAAKGSSRVPLVGPGVWNFRSEASHPWEQAWLYVTDNPYAAVTDAAGHVRLRDVPAGEYELRIWNPIAGERSAKILVESGKTANATIRF